MKRPERAPPSREMDDRAIEALCSFLEGSAWDGEPWATIIRRRLKNQYDVKLTGRAQWMYTHFHLRRIIDGDDDKAAAHVAEIWKRSKATVSSHAYRSPAKEIALQWIDAGLRQGRQEFRLGKERFYAADADVYGQLDITLTKLAQQFPNAKKVNRDTARIG